MDYYAGIDVSLEASSVCLVDSAGKIIRETKVASDPDALIKHLVSLGYAYMRRVNADRLSGQHFLHSIGDCGIHGLSPDCVTRLVAKPDPTYIRSLFETAAPTSRLRRTRAQEDETILAYGHFRAMHIPGSSHRDPPGLIGSWKICRIQFG